MPGPMGALAWGTMTDRDDDDDLVIDEVEDDADSDLEHGDEADSEPDTDPDEGADEDDGDKPPSKPQRKPLTADERKKKARETQKRIHGLLQDRWQLSTKVQELEAELARSRGESVHSSVAGAEAELQAIERDLSQAVEDGDTKAVVEHQRKHAAAVYRLEQRRAEQERYPKPDDRQPLQRQQQVQQPHPRVLEWGERVGARNWTQGELAIADTIDRALIAEGYSPDDDDFWIEADERIARVLPHRLPESARFRPGRQARTTEQRRSRPPMTPTRGGTPQAGKGLTKEERSMMREAGFDPDNERDRSLFKKYGRE